MNVSMPENSTYSKIHIKVGPVLKLFGRKLILVYNVVPST